MVFGGWIFGRWLGHEIRALVNGIMTCIKDPREVPSPYSHMKYREEKAFYEPGSGSSLVTASAGTLILHSSVLRTVRNKSLWFVNHAIHDSLL
jgi:hypothetical protein